MKLKIALILCMGMFAVTGCSSVHDDGVDDPSSADAAPAAPGTDAQAATPVQANTDNIPTEDNVEIELAKAAGAVIVDPTQAPAPTTTASADQTATPPSALGAPPELPVPGATDAPVAPVADLNAAPPVQPDLNAMPATPPSETVAGPGGRDPGQGSANGAVAPVAPIAVADAPSLSNAPPFPDAPATPDTSVATQAASTGPAPAAAMDTTSGEAKNYTVKKGDTLMKIAFENYGDLYRWKEIFEANRGKIQDPNSVPPGTELTLNGAGMVTIEKNGEQYLIKGGDTLGSISKDVYGTKQKWKELWENNRQLIKDPNKIYAGFYLYYQPAAKMTEVELNLPKETVIN